MKKEEKLKRQKEKYLELRNELLEKGYTNDEITEYLYYMADYNSNVSDRRVSNYALAATGLVFSTFSSACPTIIGNAHGELVGYFGLAVMCLGAGKSLAEEVYLNYQSSSYKLMKNIEKTVEMREVKKTNVDLGQNSQEECEHSAEKQKVLMKQPSEIQSHFDDDEK